MVSVPSANQIPLWNADNPRTAPSARVLMLTLYIHSCSSPLNPATALLLPLPPLMPPGSNPDVVMSPVWCCGGYVITPAYLLKDSLWLQGVGISCCLSPLVQNILIP